ncbi:MAG: type II toxin-antitoxin system VapB family antitoxin [Gemmatimonadota bacterium]
MALNIKNEDVERLAAEVAELTGESKTEAVRKALAERRARLGYLVNDACRADRTRRFLEREVWSRVPEELRGKAPTRAEREAILGYGPEGV